MYDFNIQNYSIQDLEKLFELPLSKDEDGKKRLYNKIDIEEKKQEFYDKIALADSMQFQNPKLIKQLNEFLDEASKLLGYLIKDNEEDNPHNSLQHIRIGDHTDNQRYSAQLKYQITEDDNMEYNYQLRQLEGTNRFMNSYTKEYYDRAKNELIKKEDKTFNTVVQNDFNPGKINPIHTPILTKCLNIDTRFRDNLYQTKSTDFIFTLPDKIRKVVNMRLSAYEFPTTFYNISESYGNNYLNVLCSFVPSQYPLIMKYAQTSVKTIIIPDGNYTSQQLIKYINEQLQPRDVSNNLIYTDTDANGIFNCIQFTYPHLSPTGKTTVKTINLDDYPYISRILAIGFDFTLSKTKEKDLTDVKKKIGWNLGFIKTKYYDKMEYDADTPINLATIRYLYLMVNDYNNSVNNNFFIGAFQSHVLNKNILARIPIQQQQSQILSQIQTQIQTENQLTQHMEPRKYFGPVDIQRLQIQVYDEFGRILDMNNANYSICLTFQCIYD